MPKDVAVTYAIRGILNTVETPAGRLYGVQSGRLTSLGPIYPQPVGLNAKATVSFTIIPGQAATLILYDIYGRERGILHDGELTEREAQVTFSPASFGLSPGTYVLRLFSASNHVTRKFSVLR